MYAGSLVDSVNEPECKVKNTLPLTSKLIELVKRYIFVYFDYPDLSADLKLMAGSIIMDYLMPLLVLDPQHYMMEYLFLHFMFELINMPESHL
jgi:hypothetical protein